jgi:hypothetical protein
MDDVLTVSRPESRSGRSEAVPATLAALAIAVLLVLVSTTLRLPDQVSLTVQNPLPWRTEVEVRGAGDSGWTGAGAVPRDGQLDFLALPDQGSDWVVRFTYAGYSEEVEVTRDQLEADGWTVQVPEALGEQLREGGVPETTGSAAGRSGGDASTDPSAPTDQGDQGTTGQ